MAQQYINTNKEFFWGDWYFKSHVMAEDFNYKAHKKELSSRYMSQGITAVDLCEKYSDPVECDRIKESFEKAVFYDDNARTREYKSKYCK